MNRYLSKSRGKFPDECSIHFVIHCNWTFISLQWRERAIININERVFRSFRFVSFSIICRSTTYPGKGTQETTLDESNKGHQLLRKMGWGGAGLGANEQGIEAPISGGEIRDKNDQYKGVGINLNDPYENFRKSKGQAFITRMKARAEERAEERGDRD